MAAALGYGNGSALARKGSLPAKAVGSFVPQITKKSFQKFGFSTTSLLTEWSSIVGQEVADVTRPEQIKWPRLRNVADETGTFSDRGATLVLRVEAARALDIEYRRSQIIGRINSHFGYGAIGDLRIIQGPIRPLDFENTCQERRFSAHATVGQHEATGDLSAALERLSQSVRQRKVAR